MKKSLLFILLAGILVYISYELFFAEASTNNNSSAVIDMDGKTAKHEILDWTDVDISGKNGKVTVLDFWASWCGPCKMQMPVMERFYSSLADPECIQVVAVNLGESRSAVENFLSKNHVSYKVALDNGRELANRFRVTAIPTTVIIDGQGNPIDVKPGYFPDLDSYLRGKIHPLAPDCVPSP